MLNEQASMNKLRWIMTELRNPETGCPWDIKQAFESITPHTINKVIE